MANWSSDHRFIRQCTRRYSTCGLQHHFLLSLNQYTYTELTNSSTPVPGCLCMVQCPVVTVEHLKQLYFNRLESCMGQPHSTLSLLLNQTSQALITLVWGLLCICLASNKPVHFMVTVVTGGPRPKTLYCVHLCRVSQGLALTSQHQLLGLVHHILIPQEPSNLQQ